MWKIDTFLIQAMVAGFSNSKSYYSKQILFFEQLFSYFENTRSHFDKKNEWIDCAASGMRGSIPYLDFVIENWAYVMIARNSNTDYLQ